MVRQIPSSNVAETALKNSCSYFTWLCQQSGLECTPLAHILYETDFTWMDVAEDDENRAKAAKDLREQYAIYLIAGDDAFSAVNEAQWHDIDILKKSILGPASVFEVLVCLARNLNDMLNMELESRVKEYFARLISNLGLDFYDESDWDGNQETVEKYWKDHIDRWLNREYLADGEGGLFPLDDPEYDQRNRSLWEQMNDWAGAEMTTDGDEWETLIEY